MFHLHAYYSLLVLSNSNISVNTPRSATTKFNDAKKKALKDAKEAKKQAEKKAKKEKKKAEKM